MVVKGSILQREKATCLVVYYSGSWNPLLGGVPGHVSSVVRIGVFGLTVATFGWCEGKTNRTAIMCRVPQQRTRLNVQSMVNQDGPIHFNQRTQWSQCSRWQQHTLTAPHVCEQLRTWPFQSGALITFRLGNSLSGFCSEKPLGNGVCREVYFGQVRMGSTQW